MGAGGGVVAPVQAPLPAAVRGALISVRSVGVVGWPRGLPIASFDGPSPVLDEAVQPLSPLLHRWGLAPISS